MERYISISALCANQGLLFLGSDKYINGLNLCNRNSNHDRILTYVTNEDYVDIINQNTAVVAVILDKHCHETYCAYCKERDITYILCDSPEKVFYDIHEYLYYQTDFYFKYNFESTIGLYCNIHSSAIIEQGVRIGNNVTIGPNTVVRKGTIIEDSCVIGCNTTIGSEGFQIIKDNGYNRKIIHTGGVKLAKGVNVGDNVTICNSLFEDTSYIGERVMIDNNTYVGHNVYIGNDSVITSSVVLCGSTTIEANAWVGVNSSVLNRVTIGNNSKIGIGSVVTRDIEEKRLAYGVPARMK